MNQNESALGTHQQFLRSAFRACYTHHTHQSNPIHSSNLHYSFGWLLQNFYHSTYIHHYRTNALKTTINQQKHRSIHNLQIPKQHQFQSSPTILPVSAITHDQLNTTQSTTTQPHQTICQHQQSTPIPRPKTFTTQPPQYKTIHPPLFTKSLARKPLLISRCLRLPLTYPHFLITNLIPRSKTFDRQLIITQSLFLSPFLTHT